MRLTKDKMAARTGMNVMSAIRPERAILYDKHTNPISTH